MSEFWNHTITVGDLFLGVASLGVARLLNAAWERIPRNDWTLRR